MNLTRRNLLKGGFYTGAAALVYPGGATLAQTASPSLTGDTYNLGASEVIVHPVNHASLVLSLNSTIIYVDPVGDMSRYRDLPPADLILVTHEHFDHFEPQTLANLSDNAPPLITNSAVFNMLSAGLKPPAISMANGDTLSRNNITIEAIPAYNMVPERLKFHPPGRDNGYVLNIPGGRIYIAGDTEDIPEMRALERIDIAFVPMILPWTMDEERAADAVNEFTPGVVYPYHYGPSDITKFKRLVDAADGGVDVRFGEWY